MEGSLGLWDLCFGVKMWRVVLFKASQEESLPPQYVSSDSDSSGGLVQYLSEERGEQ